MSLKSDPASTYKAVTPSDTVDLPAGVARGLYVGVGGDVVVDSPNSDTTILFKNVNSGELLPIMVLRVRTTNTTATNILALY